jgi:hypothetical protein
MPLWVRGQHTVRRMTKPAVKSVMRYAISGLNVALNGRHRDACRVG